MKTYLDANVLILAFNGSRQASAIAREILNQTHRQYLASDMLRLELLPKTRYFKQQHEEEFYCQYFDIAQIVPTTPAFVERAETTAGEFGLSAVDAIHLLTAIENGADEFVTAEHKDKPLFRTRSIRVVSIGF